MTNQLSKSAANKAVNSDAELHPLERTPQTNEESTDAEVQSTEKDLAIHE